METGNACALYRLILVDRYRQCCTYRNIQDRKSCVLYRVILVNRVSVDVGTAVHTTCTHVLALHPECLHVPSCRYKCSQIIEFVRSLGSGYHGKARLFGSGPTHRAELGCAVGFGCS